MILQQTGQGGGPIPPTATRARSGGDDTGHLHIYTFRISDCIYIYLPPVTGSRFLLLTKNVMIMKEILDFLTKEDDEYGLPMWFFMFALPGGLVVLMALAGTL